MSIQFIIGGSGSGKTESMYRRMIAEAETNPKKNFLVIVPEQFTLQTQRKLVDLSSHKAIMNVDVLSFKRLAYRVFDDLGIHTLQILEETGKNLVLRKVAQKQRNKLTVLRPNMNRMGYVSELKSLLSELMQYRISCQQLEDFVREHPLSAALTAKLRDVAVMYQGFSSFMEEKYITAEEILSVLAEVAEESGLLRNSVIAFDEFTGFTPVQYHLLSVLMPLAERMLFTLTMDAREDFYRSRGSFELFDMPKETLRILTELADRQHIPVLDPVVLKGAVGKRYQKASSLAFMEQNLFRTFYQRKHGAPEDISVASLKNPKEEFIYIARKINRLVQEEGYRYQEIAVVTGCVENYSRYAQEVFGKYRIPFFMDTTKDILFHPFIEFIRASLEVIQRDFSYESVFRFLRCGFLDLDSRQIDRLDNYVLAIGIRGYSMWKKRWLRLPKGGQITDLEEMEALRIRIMEVLKPLAAVFKQKESTVEQEILALYQMFLTLKVEQQLWEREEHYLKLDEQAKALEYGQIYRIVMELLDKYAGILGQECLQIQEFVEILDAGLDAAQVATIPPGYDSVTIGDIERTRLNYIKVLFFAGVNDGIIPKSEGQGGIISQYERELLREAQLPLAPGAREKTFIQRYYLYLNMTKPSEKLYMSFSRVDAEGKAQRASYLIGVMQRMFPDMQIREWQNIMEEPDYSTRDSALDYLICGRQNEEWFALAKFLLQDEDMLQRERTERLLRAPFYHYSPEPISRMVSRALYGKALEGSVTRLERFAACAYAHFLQYGLMLREREQSGFASVDMGNLYHAALARYSQKLEKSSFDWFTVREEQRKQMAKEAMAEVIAEYPDLSIYATAANRHMAERMEHIFQQTVWALTVQVRKGRFLPSKFEISFYEPDAREVLQFELGNRESISLTGRIDRMDLCTEEDRIYVKVIDYKSGSTKFDLVKIYQGTQLQLMVYMNAAMELVKKQSEKEVIPGGVLYYHIDDPVIEAEEAMTEEEEREAILMQLRPDGMVNREESVYRAMDEDFEGKSLAIPVTLKKSGEISESYSNVATDEEFAIIRDYVNMHIKETGRAILDGDISVNPYRNKNIDSCSYCPYASVCQMDLKIPGYHYRRLKEADREEVLDKMQTDAALNS